MEGFDGAEERFRFHDHSRPAPIRGIVDTPVFVECVVPEIVHLNLDNPFLQSAFKDPFIQIGIEYPGEDGNDTEFHVRIVPQVPRPLENMKG
jgi:hypothetical protein